MIGKTRLNVSGSPHLSVDRPVSEFRQTGNSCRSQQRRAGFEHRALNNSTEEGGGGRLRPSP